VEHILRITGQTEILLLLTGSTVLGKCLKTNKFNARGLRKLSVQTRHQLALSMATCSIPVLVNSKCPKT